MTDNSIYADSAQARQSDQQTPARAHVAHDPHAAAASMAARLNAARPAEEAASRRRVSQALDKLEVFFGKPWGPLHKPREGPPNQS